MVYRILGFGSFQNGNFPFWKLTGNFLKLSKPNFGGLEISSGQRKFPDFTLVYCVTAHHQVYQYTALLVLVTRDLYRRTVYDNIALYSMETFSKNGNFPMESFGNFLKLSKPNSEVGNFRTLLWYAGRNYPGNTYI